MWLGRKLKEQANWMKQAAVSAYVRLRDGDVLENWKSVLLLTRLTPGEGNAWSSREHVMQAVLVSFTLLTSIRIGFSCLLHDDGIQHLMGHTVLRFGSIGRLLSLTAGLVALQCALFRITVYRLHQKQEMNFLPIMEMVTNTVLPFDGQDKRQLGRKVLMCTVAAAVLIILMPGGVIVTVLCFTNCHHSETMVQVLLWMFWWTQDLLFVIVVATDFVLIPSMWIFLVLSLHMDMSSLADHLDKMTMGGRLRNPDQVYETYIQLTKEVTKMKPFLTPVLSIFAMCSTPLICTVTYSLPYMDNAFFVLIVVEVGSAMIVQEFAFLALASQVNSLSLRLYQLFCSIFSRHKDSLSLRERYSLLQTMEEMGSEERLLSLHTLDGEKYTTETFLIFVLDTAVHYTLLVTFGVFFKRP